MLPCMRQEPMEVYVTMVNQNQRCERPDEPLAQQIKPAQGQSIQAQQPLVVARGLGRRSIRGVPYQNIDLDIMPGTVTALVGENGSGKTALLLTLAGSMESNQGTLEVGGYPLPRKRRKVRKISGMGFVGDLNPVYPSIKVRTTVAAELELYSRKANQAAVHAYLERYGMDALADKTPLQLTTEEMDKLGIILGLANEPVLLIVDDIESQLTQHQGRKMLRFLLDIAHMQKTTIVVAVSEYEIARNADQVVLMTEEARRQAAKVEEIIAARRQGGVA